MGKCGFKKDIVFVVVISIIATALSFMPSGHETKMYPNSARAEALVISTDESTVYNTGIIIQGEQVCQVKILNGAFKGQEAKAVNRLIGKLEMDKMFKPGDRALVVIDFSGNKIKFINIIDHYRINLEVLLFLAFIILLVIFAGWTGVKALLSFVVTVLMIWKFLIPLFLKGLNPILVALVMIIFLTVVIVFLAGGLTRRSVVAVLGSLSGSVLTCILALVFGRSFKIHGAVLPFSESLLYSGYANLNLTDIFIAGIFIASSGALMDLAMDISAAISELVEKNPGISVKEKIKSGFAIGKAVIGTMTTTLLLAYSGGYIALLMVFMAQGTPVVNILNLKYVASEILHTLVGSFGLVTVAPFTAILAGFLITDTQEKQG